MCKKDIEQFLSSGPKVLSCDKGIVVINKNATVTEKLRAYDHELESISSHLQN